MRARATSGRRPSLCAPVRSGRVPAVVTRGWRGSVQCADEWTMRGVLTVGAVALLAGASWTLGTMALSRLSWPELRAYERVPLQLIAGLGLTALLLSIAALTGWFFHATAVLGVTAALGGVVALRHNSGRARRAQSVHA